MDNKKPEIDNKFDKGLYDLVKNNLDKFYKCKSSLLSPYESKVYNMINSIINEFNNENTDFQYVLFADVRLADFISPTTETYEKFKKFQGNNELIADINKYENKFSEDDYKKLIIYRLIRMHVDFLICKMIGEKYIPYLVIESNGEEHEYMPKTIMNDKFKYMLFKSNKVNIKYLIVNNCELQDDDISQARIYNRIKDSLC